MILLLMVPFPPPGFPKIKTMLVSSSMAKEACVDMKERHMLRRNKADDRVMDGKIIVLVEQPSDGSKEKNGQIQDTAAA